MGNWKQLWVTYIILKYVVARHGALETHGHNLHHLTIIVLERHGPLETHWVNHNQHHLTIIVLARNGALRTHGNNKYHLTVSAGKKWDIVNR